MNARSNRGRWSGTPVAPDSRRSRWPVFFSALILLWCAWWYCREGSQGLFYLSLGLSAFAVVRSRPLPATTRWVVWGWVLITVACLVANVTRLVPPEQALEESRAIDRVISVVFGMGLTSLLFRVSIEGVTLAAIGALPMAMVVLGRVEGTPGAAVKYPLLISWGVVAGVALADLAQRLTAPRREGKPLFDIRELGWRVLFLTAVLGVAVGLRAPMAQGVRQAQRRLFGWVMSSERLTRPLKGELSLSVPTPAGFGRRMRVVLLIDAERFPGYLRESVFVRYRNGRWLAVRPEIPLGGTASVTGEVALVPERRQEKTPALWRVEVVSPSLLSAFCVPGNAVSLTCEGPPPLADTNGTVTANGPLPDRYSLAVVPGRLLESAFPLPDGLSDPGYLDVPPALAGAVSNWVASCAGLSVTGDVAKAVQSVEKHFASGFAYRLGIRFKSTPDPLIDFMTRREGSCALFASAAALMFRQCGMPSRVIGGYVSVGWNPLLKRWVVREREGHAWVEVWDRSAGRWLVADPTPPDGRPAALTHPGRIRLAFDGLVACWTRVLAYLRGASFLEVLADAGATFFAFVWQVVWSVPGAVVLVGFGVLAGVRRHLRRRALPPVERLRAELTQAMRRIERRSVPMHLRRRNAEGWDDWLARVGPELPGERLAALSARLEAYQRLRYGVPLDESAARAWIKAPRV